MDSHAATGVATCPRLSPAALRANLVTFCVYVVSGGLCSVWLMLLDSRTVASADAPLALPWLATGFGVAALLYYGLRVWPSILVGNFVIWAGIQGLPPALMAVQAVSEVLSLCTIVVLLRRLGFRPALDRYQDSLYLFAAVAAGRTLCAGLDAVTLIVTAWWAADPTLVAGLAAAGVRRTGHAVSVNIDLLWYCLRWWANCAAACVLVVPLLALTTDRRGAVAGSRMPRREGLLLMGAVAVWLGVAFLKPSAQLRTALLATAWLPVVWAATRFGAGTAALVTLVLGTAAAFGFSLQVGSFVVPQTQGRLVTAWGFIGVLALTSLFLAALLAQRARARRHLAGSAARYQRLFAGNPYPMWAEDALTGQVLLANPAALSIYGYDERQFLALRGADLVSGTSAAVATGAGVTERHRTCSGPEIEVEVTRTAIEVAGELVRVCFAEPVAERNELRAAVLGASDVERRRLGGVINDELIPLLADLVQWAQDLAATRAPAEARTLLARINDAISAGTKICTRLTRGASPLHWAGGDLLEALRRLPALFPGPNVTVEIAVMDDAPLTLSVERSDHVYRLAEDALRYVASLPDVSQIIVEVTASPQALGLVIRDDRTVRPGEPYADSLVLRAIAARATGAQGRLELEHDAQGRPWLSFRCAQAPIVSGALPVPRAPAPRAEVPWDNATTTGRGRWLALTTLLGAVYYASGYVGLELVRFVNPRYSWAEPVLDVPWIASGVAVAGMLLGGRRLWPGVFVASLLLWHYIGDSPWLPAATDAVGEVLASLVVIWTMHRFGFRRSCDRLRDLALLALAAAASQVVSLLSDLAGALTTLWITPGYLPQHLAATLASPVASVMAVSDDGVGLAYRWWFGSCAGIVLVVPACIAWNRAAWRDVCGQPRAAMLWLATMLSAAALILLAGPEFRLATLALALAVTGWAAVRYGPPLAWVATLVFALVATVSFQLSIGALTSPAGNSDPALMWSYIALLIAAAQVLTTLLAESDRVERDLRRVDARYRALFASAPYPLFVYAADSGRILLANDSAVERYGLSTQQFRLLTLGDLEVGPGHAITLPGSAQRTTVATRHRLRDGATAEVELSLLPFTSGAAAERSGLCFVMDVTERHRLRNRLIEATDLERRKLARDFHDGVGQVLTGLQFGVRPLVAGRDTDLPDAQTLEFIHSAALEALRTCEQVLRGTSPLQETRGDLVAAIRNLPRWMPPDLRHQLTVTIEGEDALRLPLDSREQLYRIVQEALTNSMRHSQATRIGVRLKVTARDVEVVVEDDGVGFDSSRSTAGLGLDSLALRAQALRGTLAITTRDGAGTVVSCHCPQLAVS